MEEFTTKKDPFRHFGREVVLDIMKKLKIDPEKISGPARRDDCANVLYFETFDTLEDPVEYFAEAMTIELEHGTLAALVGSNVTDDDPFKSGQIANAHLSGVEYDAASPYDPNPTYYDVLIWVERLHSAAIKLRKCGV